MRGAYEYTPRSEGRLLGGGLPSRKTARLGVRFAIRRSNQLGSLLALHSTLEQLQSFVCDERHIAKYEGGVTEVVAAGSPATNDEGELWAILLHFCLIELRWQLAPGTALWPGSRLRCVHPAPPPFVSPPGRHP